MMAAAAESYPPATGRLVAERLVPTAWSALYSGAATSSSCWTLHRRHVRDQGCATSAPSRWRRGLCPRHRPGRCRGDRAGFTNALTVRRRPVGTCAILIADDPLSDAAGSGADIDQEGWSPPRKSRAGLQRAEPPAPHDEPSIRRPVGARRGPISSASRRVHARQEPPRHWFPASPTRPLPRRLSWSGARGPQAASRPWCCRKRQLLVSGRGDRRLLRRRRDPGDATTRRARLSPTRTLSRLLSTRARRSRRRTACCAGQRLNGNLVYGAPRSSMTSSCSSRSTSPATRWRQPARGHRVQGDVRES